MAIKPPKLKPFIGCLNCGGSEMKHGKDSITLNLRTRLYNGFGGWTIHQDGELYFCGPVDKKINWYPTLLTFEYAARLNPDCDWLANLDTPLRSAVYQRQGKNRWVLIETGRGFA